MAKKESKNENKVKKHFFKDFKAELKKVIWPTPKQLLNNTVAVITIVLITAVITFAFDVAFDLMNKHGISNLQSIVDENFNSEEETNSTENTDNTEENEERENSSETIANGAAESGTSYIIRPGDTLYQISLEKYGTMDKINEICRMNGISEDELIYPGQIIVLP